jgi:hypothetical protein
MCTMVYFTATEANKKAVQQAILAVQSELGEDVAYLIATYKRGADYYAVIDKHTRISPLTGKTLYNWRRILQICGKFPDHLIRQYESCINMVLVLQQQCVPEDVADRFLSKDVTTWNVATWDAKRLLCSRPDQLTDELIIKHHKHMEWPLVVKHYEFSDNLLYQLEELGELRYALADYISERYNLSLDMIYNLSRYLHWSCILTRYKLPERHLRRGIRISHPRWNWTRTCIYQDLSEEFMEEHRDHLDWSEVATYQRMSDTFIEQHHHHLPWRYLRCNRHISAERKAMLKKTLYNDAE